MGYPKKSVIIDINTLNIRGATKEQLLKNWRRNNVLLYDGSKGEKPFVVEEPYNTKVKLIDVTKLNPDELGKALKNL